MRSSWHEGQLALPLVFFLPVVLHCALGIMALISFYANLESRELGLDQYAKFLFDPFNLGVLTDTIWLGLKATIVCLVLGYPICLGLHASLASLADLIMALGHISAPDQLRGQDIRLDRDPGQGRRGQYDAGQARPGSAPLSLLYTRDRRGAALAQIWMPMMVLPVINSLLQIESSLPESSAALGAGPWRHSSRSRYR